MADIDKITVGSTTYNVKDASARESISQYDYYGVRTNTTEFTFSGAFVNNTVFQPMLVLTAYGAWLVSLRGSNTTAVVIPLCDSNATLTAVRNGSTVTLTFSSVQYGGVRVYMCGY